MVTRPVQGPFQFVGCVQMTTIVVAALVEQSVQIATGCNPEPRRICFGCGHTEVENCFVNVVFADRKGFIPEQFAYGFGRQR